MPKVFLSGAVGDVLTVEAHFPHELRQNLTHVYLASKPCHVIKELFTDHPAFPKLEQIEVLWDKFDRSFPCFTSLDQCRSHLRSRGIGWRCEGVEDWSIANVFPRIRAKQLKFTGSSFAQRTEEGEYVLIHPLTKSIPVRQFDERQWEEVRNMLCRFDCQGIVLGAEDMPLPKGVERVNTSIQEAITLAANAKAFIGVDSMLSVAAAFWLPSDRLRVFTGTRHCVEWKDAYYPVVDNYKFIVYHNGLILR